MPIKASKRMYFLRQLKRAKVSTNDMVYFYCTCIRSVVEYASPVFHYALPGYLSDDLERIQKRVLFGTILGPSFWDHLGTWGTVQRWFSNLQTLFTS